MTDLISRADAIRAIDHIGSVDTDADREYAIGIINALPSARLTGEWIPNHDGSWNCSECGLRVLVYAKGNFCPNCGADMR